MAHTGSLDVFRASALCLQIAGGISPLTRRGGHGLRIRAGAGGRKQRIKHGLVTRLGLSNLANSINRLGKHGIERQLACDHGFERPHNKAEQRPRCAARRFSKCLGSVFLRISRGMQAPENRRAVIAIAGRCI